MAGERSRRSSISIDDQAPYVEKNYNLVNWLFAFDSDVQSLELIVLSSNFELPHVYSWNKDADQVFNDIIRFIFSLMVLLLIFIFHRSSQEYHWE